MGLHVKHPSEELFGMKGMIGTACSCCTIYPLPNRVKQTVVCVTRYGSRGHASVVHARVLGFSLYKPTA